jgi:predicted RND superfamily exporter protein
MIPITKSTVPKPKMGQQQIKFDRNSGNWFERLVFNNRGWFIAICFLVSIALGYHATRLRVDASFDGMLPQSHPYIHNYIENRNELRGLGNVLRVVVEAKDGDIYSEKYQRELAKINDAIFLLPGVDRPWVKSLWSPVVRWTEVTEQGFGGGPVMPESFSGTKKDLDLLRLNVERAGLVGNIVGNDYHSSMIIVPLLESTGSPGEGFDYPKFNQLFDEQVRSLESDTVRIHVVGFAQLVGDLLKGLNKVMTFFAIAALIATAVIYSYTRCVRSTAVVVACSAIAVVWQLGLISFLGFHLDPFSILVPFLVFAIGVSHGAQKMNGIMQDIARGEDRLVAARFTFRRLILAGLTALVADAVGFAVLMVIDIPVIRNLALSASIGVAILTVTNLLLVPVLLSYVGVGSAAARRALRAEEMQKSALSSGSLWGVLDRFAERRWAVATLIITALLTLVGFTISLNLKIGDPDAGAPELRADSRYNQDNAFINSNYALSSDVFALIAKGPADSCGKYENLVEMDRVGWQLAQLPQVQKIVSLSETLKQYTMGAYEGNPKYWTLIADQGVLNSQLNLLAAWNTDQTNQQCSVSPVLAYLTDHRADTLERVVQVASELSEKHSTSDQRFLLAAGSAGIEAATNIVVKDSNRKMLLYVYISVIVLCYITFRNWKAVIVAVVPLAVTSVLAEALMVMLGIGVKVATLPVIALGVGIGVDYALYLLSVQLAGLRSGLGLKEAYRQAVAFTGKVVALVGVTLAAGVITWAWSPIKFQADMGILLTFMFLWNMVGALILIPALSHFLLKPAHREAQPADEFLPNMVSK